MCTWASHTQLKQRSEECLCVTRQTLTLGAEYERGVCVPAAVTSASTDAAAKVHVNDTAQLVAQVICRCRVGANMAATEEMAAVLVLKNSSGCLSV